MKEMETRLQNLKKAAVRLTPDQTHLSQNFNGNKQESSLISNRNMMNLKLKFESTLDILQNFHFSQYMAENLINDLLDLAKLENNTFSFTNEYFNLMDTIYQAFKISQNTAN